MRTLHCKVAGTTYEGRQEYLARLTGKEPVRLIPEPDNPYDPNAIAVYVSVHKDNLVEMIDRGEFHDNIANDALQYELLHCGYIPRELAKDIAPLMEGESIDCNIEAVTGGFELDNGEIAAYGLRLIVQLPDKPVGNITL